MLPKVIENNIKRNKYGENRYLEDAYSWIIWDKEKGNWYEIISSISPLLKILLSIQE